MTDHRPLAMRVQALANRFRAQAIGYRKMAARSAQDATNADRDADVLEEAVAALRVSE